MHKLWWTSYYDTTEWIEGVLKSKKVETVTQKDTWLAIQIQYNSVGGQTSRKTNQFWKNLGYV